MLVPDAFRILDQDVMRVIWINVPRFLVVVLRLSVDVVKERACV